MVVSEVEPPSPRCEMLSDPPELVALLELPAMEALAASPPAAVAWPALTPYDEVDPK